MSVLVTGGSGFIGRYLIRHLLTHGTSNIISMDIVPPPPSFAKWIDPHMARFRYVSGNTSQLYDLTNAIKSFSVEKIVNLAYLFPPASEIDIKSSVMINILGNFNVFEAARLLGASRVVYASSIALFGGQEEYGGREVIEEDREHPSLLYGMGKQLAEKMAEKYLEQYGLRAICFRPGHVFGHGRESGYSAPYFSGLISLPAIGKPVRINIEGTSKFSAIYVEDLAELIRILLEAPSPKHGAYNTGGYTTTLASFADAVKEFIPASQIEFGREAWHVANPYKLSGARAKEEFNFCVRPFKEAVLAHINRAREEAGLQQI